MNLEPLLKDRGLGIYIHIPFCMSRCSYCDFNTYVGMDSYIDRYVDAVCAEMKNVISSLEHRIRAETVFIGGGTPSCIQSVYVGKILRALSDLTKSPEAGADAGAEAGADADIRAATECTIEANPGTLTKEKLLYYRGLGINRLSVGLQSSHAKLLSILGRKHSFDDFKKNIDSATSAGFDNINVDVIFGIPGQSYDDWIATLDEVVGLGVQHISCYSLSIEKGTKIHLAVEKGIISDQDEALDRRMYHYAIDYLRQKGYNHYEISNFAMPGYECRHNMKYWTCGEYLGFGAGAHSYYDGVRFSNAISIPDYVDKINSLGIATVDSASEKLDDVEKMKEFAIMRLRLKEGINTAQFESEFGADFFDVYGDSVRKLEKEGLICVEQIRREERFYSAVAATAAADVTSCADTAGVGAAAGADAVATAGADAAATTATAIATATATSTATADRRQYMINLTRKGLDFANKVFVEFI